MTKQKAPKEMVYPLKIDSKLITAFKDLAKKNRRTIKGELTIAIENHINTNK